MMTARAPSDPDTAMMLGEVRAQLRELIHQGNNQAMKNDAVAKALVKLESMPEQLEKIERRLTKLEIAESQHVGERGVLSTLLNSSLVQWAATLAVALYVWWKGHGQ